VYWNPWTKIPRYATGCDNTARTDSHILNDVHDSLNKCPVVDVTARGRLTNAKEPSPFYGRFPGEPGSAGLHSASFLFLFRKRISEDKRHRFFAAGRSLRHPTNQQCQGTEGKSKQQSLTPTSEHHPLTFRRIPLYSWGKGRFSLYAGSSTPLPQT